MCFQLTAPDVERRGDVIKKLYLRFMQTSRISLQRTASQQYRLFYPLRLIKWYSTHFIQDV